MGRKSLKAIRRREIIEAFSRVLAEHGYAGATIQAIAIEADLSSGLIHHHFKNKDEILQELLSYMVSNFRESLKESDASNLSLEKYISVSLGLGPKENKLAARCWVGIFSEAVRSPQLFNKVKKYIATEIELIEEVSGRELTSKQSASLLSFIIGSLVLGSFAPNKVLGFSEENALNLLGLFQGNSS